jgi:hypothetical protein
LNLIGGGLEFMLIPKDCSMWKLLGSLLLNGFLCLWRVLLLASFDFALLPFFEVVGFFG